jgi:hypothetical protein
MKNSTLLFLFFGLVYLMPFSSATAQIVINEFMSSNNETLFDEDGDSSDWLEIFNTSGESVSLAGYYLSDDIEDLHKWPFPAFVLSPESYLIIYCSSKNRSDIDMPLHTNFNLNAEGEDVLLVKDDEIIQHILPVDLEEDIAFAAFPDENHTFLSTAIASPGRANLLDLEVGFSHEAGFYENVIALSLNFSKPALGDVEIRYTLMGDEPSSTDALFTNSILIDNRSQEENLLADIPCTPDFADWDGENHYPAWAPPEEKIAKGRVIRAAAFLAGQRISRIATRTYFVFPEGRERYDFPVVSISCPVDSLFSFERGIYVPGAALEADNLVWSGNYFNTGSDWERRSNFEYFDDGEAVVNQTIGLRIHGGKTRGAAQKTMRLYARSSYGEKRLDYPFFSNKEQSSYKRLLLRTTMGAWTNTILADAFAHQAARDLNLDIQEYQPVIVFINGEYWGVHELREHFDQHKLADDYGLDKDAINIYSSYGEVLEGEADTEFIYLRDQYLVQNDITDPQVYDYIKERFDIDHLIDYFFTEIFFNNPDWPGNNSKMWRSDSYDNKFRWLFYDLDGGMGENQIDDTLLAELLGGESAGGEDNWTNALISTLMKNETFKEQFISRAKYLLQETFSPESLYPLVQQMTAEYAGEMDEHFGRWRNWQSTAIWQNNVSTDITKFVFLRACEMEAQMVDYFGIEPFLECNSEELSDAHIYPNPSGGIINIVLDIDREGLYFCLVHNQLGQLIRHQNIVLSSFGGSLDLSSLPAGGYYLSIFDGRMEKITTKQVVIH